jgi:hypothetical protein
MRFLVDGYNLMYAAGYLGSQRHDGSLEARRRRCLDWLAGIVATHHCEIRVVFDGQNAPKPSAESQYRGVLVRFAYRQTADDLIETLLDELPTQNLVVVSNDQRLHESARRAKAIGWLTHQFLDWASTEPAPARSPSAPPPPEKPTRLTPDIEDEFLKAFEQPRWRR